MRAVDRDDVYVGQHLIQAFPVGGLEFRFDIRVHPIAVVVVDGKPETAGAADSRLIGVLEKPRPDQTPSRLAISARYVFSPDIFAQIDRLSPAPSGEYYLTDAISALIAAGAPVRAVRPGPLEKRCDIGNHLAYFEAFVDSALDDPEHGTQMRAYLRKKLAADLS